MLNLEHKNVETYSGLNVFCLLFILWQKGLILSFGEAHFKNRLILCCRPDPTVEIAFIRRRLSSSSSSGSHSPICPQGCGAGGAPQTRAPGPGSVPPQPSIVTKITSSRNPACETLPPVNITQVCDPHMRILVLMTLLINNFDMLQSNYVTEIDWVLV